MSEHINTLLARSLFEVFGERDGERRRAVIRDLFAEGVVFSDPHGHSVGHEALDRAVVALHKQLPDFVFAARGPTQALQNAGRLQWGLGLPGDPPQITGVDFILVENDKVAALYTFLDPIVGDPESHRTT